MRAWQRHPKEKTQDSIPDAVRALLEKADVGAADRLSELAAESDKALAKAARSALYKLKLAGIEPSSVPARVSGAPVRPSILAHRAVMTHVAGNGSRMLLFVREDPHGGSPYLITFLTNDRKGLLDLGGRKMPRRRLDETLAEFSTSDERVTAEVPVDYARFVLHEAARLNAESREPIPEGYSDWIRDVGEPEREYQEPPVYEHIDPEAARKDYSISHDPIKLLEEDPFQGWVVPQDGIRSWIDKYQESQRSRLALDESQLAALGDKVIDDATDSIMGEWGASAYKGRLLDTAYVLQLAGRTEEARQAVYHVTTLRADVSPHSQPLLRAIVSRTISLILELQAREADRREKESPGLIHRI